jgi:adenylosuccinate lyase
MGPFDRFDDRAKRVFALAQDEAVRLKHNYIGTEHLLLGLVREGEGVAARVLDSLGVEFSRVRTAVESIIGRGDATTSPSVITLSPRTKKVVELALDEARKLGHSHVGTEHVLLGLLREGEGIAGGVLESLGVSLEKVRHEVIATLGQPHTPTSQRDARGIQDRFDTISPMDYRFYGGDQELFDALHPYLSEDAAVAYRARAEAALAKSLAEEGLCSEADARAIEKACADVIAAEVVAEEQRTRHDMRALVNVIRSKTPQTSRRFVHLGATSSDIIDSANARRYREALEHVVIPALGRLVARCIAIAETEADTPQIGRTHGQFAEPITFGFAMSAYVSRLGSRIDLLANAARALPGKLSGAVGAYNALGLLVPDPRALERRYLDVLGLESRSQSSQIVEAEPWADLAHACISTMGVMANVADDMRHLQRSEIAEITEAFGDTQVGSSTMPHKRNPVSFENVKSVWKAFAPRIVTTYMDQISEHQRDLTNSASQRFLGEMIAATAYCAIRLERSLARIRVDRERMKANLAAARSQVVAEPLYILLAKHGHDDAHEIVRRLTLESERSGKPLLDVALQSEELRTLLAELPPEERAALDRPEEYRGLAASVARQTASSWRERLRRYLVE